MNARGALRCTPAGGWPRLRGLSPRCALGWACLAMLHSAPAFASKEGAAVVEVFRIVIPAVLLTFAACLVGGLVHGAVKARRVGESMPSGIARGLLRGLIAFVIVIAAALVLLSIVGAIWIAYSFVYVYVINPDPTR